MFFKTGKWKYLCYKIEEHWERLGIKDHINQNPRVIIGITVVSIFLFVLIAVGQLMPNKPAGYVEPKNVWFYDLNSKELFTAKSSKLPPIKAPSGPLPDGKPAGVRAYVFSCNDSDVAEPQIVFLETLSPEGKKIQKAYDPRKHNAKEWAKGRLFRRPDDEGWVHADSPEGRAIYEEFFVRENNKEFPVRSKIR